MSRWLLAVSAIPIQTISFLFSHCIWSKQYFDGFRYKFTMCLKIADNYSIYYIVASMLKIKATIVRLSRIDSEFVLFNIYSCDISEWYVPIHIIYLTVVIENRAQKQDIWSIINFFYTSSHQVRKWTHASVIHLMPVFVSLKHVHLHNLKFLVTFIFFTLVLQKMHFQ